MAAMVCAAAAAAAAAAALGATAEAERRALWPPGTQLPCRFCGGGTFHGASVPPGGPFNATLLTAADVDAGAGSGPPPEGLGWGRLACAARRLLGGGGLRAAALGGSVSAGKTYEVCETRDGAPCEHLWHQRLQRWGRAAYPAGAAALTVHNGAVPATGPDYMALCLANHLPDAADLVLVEYAVNTLSVQQVPSFEALLRRLLALPHSPAVVVVNAHRWGASHTDCLARSPRRLSAPSEWDRIADEMTRVAAHYGVPLVSLRQATVAQLRAGADIRHFMRDCRHPNALGQAWMAQLAARQIRRAEGGRCSAGGGAAALPAPLLPTATAAGGGPCLRGSALRAAAAGGAPGWHWEGEPKPGWASEGAPEAGELSISLAATAGFRRLWVGFERTWQSGAGSAELRCRGGCGCRSAVAARDTSQRSTVVALQSVAVAPAGTAPCSVAVSARGGRFKLVSLVGHDSGAVAHGALSFGASAPRPAWRP
eukprot:TRINITY_DN30715_c0_g1_i1.p1 TRINITY_DN30715_c0_g1~~TRINITY_DN30715_c0_g1_i1.p1  ORF type:complete len:483 (+),score=78.83 TRINITY_DN30715_c0_g1_i1:62-1510(+)